jgi:hypothetical protein
MPQEERNDMRHVALDLKFGSRRIIIGSSFVWGIVFLIVALKGSWFDIQAASVAPLINWIRVIWKRYI